jgi:rod shape-determining protein MreC
MDTRTPINLGRAPRRSELRLPDTARGNLVRLALFLVASALLGHWQASRPAGQMLVREGVAAVAAPIVAGLSAAANGIRDTGAVLPRVSRIAAENRRLEDEVADMHRHNVALAEQAREAQRLRALLGLRSGIGAKGIAAAVIGRQLSRWPTAIIIDKGRADGIRPRQPVIAAAGLVGRIYSASAHSALVVPISDRNSSAGAMLQRTRDAGILEGDGDRCLLNYLPLQADVSPGDVVVSSGLGVIFPRGILIGAVESVARDDTAAVKSARVRLSVDLPRLEEVLVLRR